MDSQADISLIKISALNNETLIDKNNTIEIKGITPNTIATLGTIHANLHFNDTIIEHELHVVPDDFCINSDGIIGRDFMKENNCVINYRNMTLEFEYENKSIKIEIENGPLHNHCTVPSYSEVYRICKLAKCDKPVVVPAQDLAPGVYIARAIVDPTNPIVKILNTTEKTQTVSINKIKTESIDDYDIYSFNENEYDTKRKEKIREVLKNRMPEHIKPTLLPLCEEYADIFALDGDKLTVNNFYGQKLRLKDNEPVYIKNYRTPFAQRPEIDKQVNELLKNGLIEPSQSNYNSPLILVPKKGQNGEKKWRLCVDFRGVNRKLIADKFPLTRIDDVLDNLGRTKYFSIIDLYSGFWQIPVHPDSRDPLSFSTTTGAYRFKVLPFGINIAPNSFTRVMQIAFSGLDPNAAFLYVDDVIVTGCSETHHLNNLRQVFEVFRSRNLKINPMKVQFFRNEVTFLGHRCTSEGILPDNTKFDVIKNYPTPQNKDEAKRFVATANYYRRFLPSFATKTAILNKLSRKNVIFEWTNDHQKAFETIKNDLISPRVLAYPDLTKEFIVTTDASKLGCGAVLSQNINGQDRPICFASHAFDKYEQKKKVIELELIAIHFAIKKFRPYLYGTHFTVRTDHKPLKYLYSLADPSNKLTRIRLELEEYNFTVEYIKGKSNVVADALSRITFDEIKKTPIDPKTILVTTRSMTKKSQKEKAINDSKKLIENVNKDVMIYDQFDNVFDKTVPKITTELFVKNDQITKLQLKITKKHKKVLNVEFVIANETLDFDSMFSHLENQISNYNINLIEWPKNDLIFKTCTINNFKTHGNRVLKHLQIRLIDPIEIVDELEKRNQLMNIYHQDKIVGGHCGQKKLYAKLRNKFYWKNMTKDISKFVKSCTDCQQNKVKIGGREELKITPTPMKPFDVVIIDTIGPLPTSENDNKYAVTMICDMSKYLVTIAVPDKSARTLAKAIFENFILIYGAMKSIRTDLGTEYKNELFKELCNLLKIEHNFSTAYHHESVGTVERNHRVFNEYIRSYIQDNIEEWDKYLRYFTFYHNTTTNTAFDNKFTPYQLVFGKEASLPNELNKCEIDPLYNHENYVKELKYRMQRSNILARNSIIKHKNRNKDLYDKNAKPIDLQIGDKIFIKKEPYNKFKSIYEGPFSIESMNGENISIKDNNKLRQIHKNRIRLA